MSFGFSAGDFLAVGSLALNLYLSYKDGPSDFRELCRELLTLHATLEQLQFDIDDPTSIVSRCRPSQGRNLKEVVGRCKETLVELDELKRKYTKLDGGKQKVSWKRLKYVKEDVGAIQNKLSVHLNSIAVYLANVGNRIEEMFYELVEEIKRTKEGQTTKATESAIILAPDHSKIFPWGEATIEAEVDEIINVLGDNHSHNDISKEELEENRKFIGALVLWKDQQDSKAPTPQDRPSYPSGYHLTSYPEPSRKAERSSAFNHDDRYSDQTSRSNYRQPTIKVDDDETSYNNRSPIYPASHRYDFCSKESEFEFEQSSAEPVYGGPNLSSQQHGSDDFYQASHGSGLHNRKSLNGFDYSYAGEQSTERVNWQPSPMYTNLEVEPVTTHGRRESERQTLASPLRRPKSSASHGDVPNTFEMRRSPGAPSMQRNSGGTRPGWSSDSLESPRHRHMDYDVENLAADSRPREQTPGSKAPRVPYEYGYAFGPSSTKPYENDAFTPAPQISLNGVFHGARDHNDTRGQDNKDVRRPGGRNLYPESLVDYVGGTESKEWTQEAKEQRTSEREAQLKREAERTLKRQELQIGYIADICLEDVPYELYNKALSIITSTSPAGQECRAAPAAATG
ncbi:hypothetical protein K440DRAFT_661700 [Wilcoxina mikolae CBS 423.85]|nr:hypothetical protein K440DRAFT_661700 [Wilcoxina mikolae CBS 423.85]